MSRDYVPNQVEKFKDWQNTAVTIAGLKIATWHTGLTALPPELMELKGLYEDKYSIANNPETRTKGAIAERQTVQKEYTKALREFFRQYILYNKFVPIADREAMGLKIYDTTRTPAPKPSTMPVGNVDFSIRRRHTLRIKDSVHTGRGLPSHVHGFEVWRKIGGTAPVNSNEFEYAGFSSTSSFTINYELEQVGLTVYYIFRWVNARNEPGPWSEGVTSATIA
ncbi:MAG: hypothetical protein LBD27_02945 [Tannerella sp.]|jgi:hypothetical protein|nr:hypothetical protein [Tannerella sp.]